MAFPYRPETASQRDASNGGTPSRAITPSREPGRGKCQWWGSRILRNVVAEANRRKNLLVTYAFVLFGGPGILAVYVPAWITRWRVPPTPWESRLIAFAVIAIGLVPLADSISRFVREGRGTLSPSHPTENLVIQGLYRYVRNPMYLGVLTLIAGQTVLFRSWQLGIYLVCVAVGFHLFVVFYEEPTLKGKYGQAFEQYCGDVPRWIPRFK